MNFRERAERAAEAVCEMLHVEASEDLQKRVTDVIERAVIDAVVEDGERCTEVVMDCCSADRDLAHKIADEIRRAHTVLVANLSSMR